MGKELHDNINQVLAAVKLFLNIAATQETMRDEMIQKSSEKVSYCIQEIRKLSHTLLPPSLDENSLTKTILDLIETIQETTGMKVECQFPDYDFSQLSDTQQVNIYRIIQEQINNVIKHANAKNLQIGIAQTNHHIDLLIKDDGVGFDLSSKRSGVGLKNIQNRAQILQGEMKINSAPNEGCALLVSFPLN